MFKIKIPAHFSNPAEYQVDQPTETAEDGVYGSIVFSVFLHSMPPFRILVSNGIDC